MLDPNVEPSFFITDKSSAELSAVAQVHPKAVKLLCDFHASTGTRSLDQQ